MLKIVLDNARVNRFFKNDFRFVDDLTDEIKTYTVNMYVITLNCRLLVNEYSMPSIATFSIKMCCRDYSVL